MGKLCTKCSTWYVSKRCPQCRANDRFLKSQKEGKLDVCSRCHSYSSVSSNGQCFRCLRDQGLAECSSCRAVKIRLLDFHSKKAQCVECLTSSESRSLGPNAYRAKIYGISVETYQKMWFDQEGRCAICKEPETTQILSIDHCHKTNKVRGLLCQRCNLGLGNFRDGQENLRAAITYLENAGSKQAGNSPKPDQTSLMQDLVRDAAKHRAENQILKEQIELASKPQPAPPSIDILPYFVWLRAERDSWLRCKEKRPATTTIEARIQRIEEEMVRLRNLYPEYLKA